MLCQVELRAFCLKHSDLPENRSILPLKGSIAGTNDISEANGFPVALPVSGEQSLKDCRNGGLASDSSPDKLNHNDELPDGGLSDCRLSAHDDMLGCGAVPQQDVGVVGRANENVDASDSLSFALVLKKVFCIISISIRVFVLDKTVIF